MQLISRIAGRSRWASLTLLAALTLMLVAEYGGVNLPAVQGRDSIAVAQQTRAPAEGNRRAEFFATVQQVIDGDTVVLLIDGKREHARLIGIDAPESRDNQRAHRTAQKEGLSVTTLLAMGKRSAEHLRGIIGPGSRVVVEFDVERRDRYWRLLVYLRSDTAAARTINEAMVYDGFAYPYTVPPNVRHAQSIARSFSEARTARRGLWSD